MSTHSPLAIPDSVAEANRRFLDARRQLAPSIIAECSGLKTAKELRTITDRWLCELWHQALPAPFEDAVSVHATGGYGRDELCLHSDIDVLIALHDPDVADAPEFALAMERLMAWSRHTRVSLSHAVRTPAQARQLLADDLHTAIALLDMRHLAGPRAQQSEFSTDAVIQHLRGDDRGRRFVLALIDEYRRRIARNGQTVFLLEPDLKNGEGGLRDLNYIAWAGQVRWEINVRTDTNADVDWTDGERTSYGRRLDALLALRNRLHLLRRRKHDRLTFREQEALARLDGLDVPEDTDAAIATTEEAVDAASSPRGDDPQRQSLDAVIESQMANYYRRARAISTTCERSLRRWTDDPDAPSVRRGKFEVCGGRLCLPPEATLGDDDVFEALVIAGDQDLLLDPRLEAQLEQRVERWPRGDDVPAAIAHRLGSLLTDHDIAPRTSRRLLELDVITRIVPEFEPLLCHVHHDLYHVYTTDIHSLKCLEQGRAILHIDPDDHPRPLFCRSAHRINDVRSFLMACLFHDVGKNRGGGHSEKGAQMMASIAPRLGLDDRQTDRVVFLVRHHLSLSNTSRRRDISDPEIIDGLATTIGDLETLDQLTALTYCDMTTVGPEVMNDWNASLLVELVQRLRAALSTSAPQMTRSPRARPGLDEADRRRHLARLVADSADLDDHYLDDFVDALPLDHLLDAEPAALLRQYGTYRRALKSDDGTAVSLRPLNERGVTEIIVSAPDRPGTLAQITGAIASTGVNIMAADIVTTADGHGLDIFHVAHFNPRAVPPAQPRPVDAPRRLERLEERICDALAGRVDIEEVLRQRRDEQRLAPRPVPAVSTEILVDTDTSSRFTIIEVRAPDRHGLLYAIARTFLDCQVDIRVSRIDSLGHQAIDTFYVEEWTGGPLPDHRITEVVEALHETLQSSP